MDDKQVDNKKVKVRMVTMDELNRLTIRLRKITNFNFTGAILCMMAGIYFAQAGRELLPKIFVGLMALTLLMTILSYRASSKVSSVIEIVQRKKSKR